MIDHLDRTLEELLKRELRSNEWLVERRSYGTALAKYERIAQGGKSP